MFIAAIVSSPFVAIGVAAVIRDLVKARALQRAQREFGSQRLVQTAPRIPLRPRRVPMPH